MRASPRIRSIVLAAGLAALLVVPTPSLAHEAAPPPCEEGAYLTLVAGTQTSIICSGDEVGDFEFQGIPDGIGIAPGPSSGTVDVYVTHEESHVPFQGEADFQDSTVSKLTIDTSGTIVGAEVAIPASQGFLRFCSAFMAGPAEGFSNYTFFANEETNDIVPVPPGATYGPDPSVAPNRQGGYAVILDEATGAFTHVPGMGRHNHENTVVIPGGWPQKIALSTDDTFNAPSSQLYSYVFNSEAQLWGDGGSLWAFQVTATNAGNLEDPYDPFNGANDYGDIEVGDNWKGRFIRVPKDIAKGVTAERPQDALENWSNANNVFQFIRLEDVAYDRNNRRVVYLADTGERRAQPDEEFPPAQRTGRLHRGPSSYNGPYPNGRIFKMVFNRDNPRRVDRFSILLNSDLGGPNNPAVMHQPDNMDTSENSLMVQEDSGQAPPSRIWRYDLTTRTWSVVAQVNNQLWESSGIVDASGWGFGEGAWLVDVQAHGSAFWVDHQHATTERPWTLKQEAGQLLIIRIPGT